MVNTRAMSAKEQEDKFEKLFAMMENMQEELKNRIDETTRGQESLKEEMKESLKEEMKSSEERLENKMKSGQEEMQANIVQAISTKVDAVAEKVERNDERLGKVEEKIEEFDGKIGSVENHVQLEIGDLKKRLDDLETKPVLIPANCEFQYSKPTVKPLTFDGQTSWGVFKTQFDVVSNSNGWSDSVKASQLVSCLRGSAAEVLQGIPANQLNDVMAIEKALESRFGDSHLIQFYRTELKTRRQRAGESFQVLAADIERLMSLAYSECPLDIRESLASQFFVDAIRDEDTQHATRLMDAKDLRSALAYAMKYETSRTASKSFKHVRSMELDEDNGNKEKDKFDSLLKNVCAEVCAEIRKLSVQKNAPRRNPDITCWRCNKRGHVQRECKVKIYDQEN